MSLFATIFQPFLTSENVAARSGVGRDVQDKLAARSHARAAAAQASGRFRDEIVPVKTKIIDPKTEEEKAIVVSDDDGIRPGVTVQSLGQLRTVFKKDGTTTAGNSTQVRNSFFCSKEREGERRGGGRKRRSKALALSLATFLFPGSRNFRCASLGPRPFSSDKQSLLDRFVVKGESETERKGRYESGRTRSKRRSEVGRRPLSPSFTRKRRSLLSRTQKFESPFPVHFPIEGLYETP